MKPALLISAAFAMAALSACGGGDDSDKATSPSPGMEIDGSDVNITADCGEDPITMSPGTHLDAENTTCEEAVVVIKSVPYSNCDFSADPTCELKGTAEGFKVEGYVCEQTLEEDGDVSIIECTKGDSRVTSEAFTTQYYENQ